MPGPYVYAKVDELENTEKVGSHSCVALVQNYASVPYTSTWREGAIVRGNMTIIKGTAIATFVNGRYPNAAHGNHAALYISQDATGIKIMDQWTSNTKKPKVSARTIPFQGKDRKGNYLDPSNNADAFSIIN